MVTATASDPHDQEHEESRSICLSPEHREHRVDDECPPDVDGQNWQGEAPSDGGHQCVPDRQQQVEMKGRTQGVVAVDAHQPEQQAHPDDQGLSVRQKERANLDAQKLKARQGHQDRMGTHSENNDPVKGTPPVGRGSCTLQFLWIGAALRLTFKLLQCRPRGNVASATG